MSSVLALFGRPHDLELEGAFQHSVANAVSTNGVHLVELAEAWGIQGVPLDPGAAVISDSDRTSDDCIAIIVDAPETGAIRTVAKHWVLLVRDPGGVYCWDPDVKGCLFKLTEGEAREALERRPGIRFLRGTAG